MRLDGGRVEARVEAGGVIGECNCRRTGAATLCVLPLMLDASRDKLRLIFNGKYLNSYLEFPKFKYEGLQNFVDVLRPGDGLYNWDYKSGYYHVDLHEAAREYVAFEWGGTWYEFCVLPFGLAPACWVFTKITQQGTRRQVAERR